MKHATTTDGTITGVITGVFATPQPFPTVQVPDHVGTGWQRVNGTWRKSDAQAAAEQEEADNAAEAETLKAAIATFRAGTATSAQVQRAIAYLLKRV